MASGFFLSRIDFEMNRNRKAKVKREQPCGHAASSLKNTIRGGLLTEEGEGVDEFAQRTYALHINRYISPSITQKVLKVITLSPQKNTVLRWGGEWIIV